jgi:hypothetical protein
VNFKLRLLSIWMPESLIIAEIDRIAKVTIKCLNQLLKKYAPENQLLNEKLVMKGNILMRRLIMADAQNIRVKNLIESLGYGEAVKIGRKSLYQVGLKLGLETRQRLNLNDSQRDLLNAAQILYRVLGIEFHIIEEDDKIFLIVEKCSLAAYYTKETCRILSAVDEGVVHGLNNNFSMTFKKRITEGHSECQACILNK